MPVLISDDTLREMEVTEEEMRLEIAILLYKSKRVSIGKAAEFAGISKMDMHRALADRDIALNLTVEDVRSDWEAAKKFNLTGLG